MILIFISLLILIAAQFGGSLIRLLSPNEAIQKVEEKFFTHVLVGFSIQMILLAMFFMVGLGELRSYLLYGSVVSLLICDVARRLQRWNRDFTSWRSLARVTLSRAAKITSLSVVVVVALRIGRPLHIGPDFYGNAIAARGLEDGQRLQDLQTNAYNQAFFWLKENSLSLPNQVSADIKKEVIYSFPSNAEQYVYEFVANGQRLGLTLWGGFVSNASRAIGISIFGIFSALEVIFLISALAVCWGMFRKHFEINQSVVLAGMLFLPVPFLWGWLVSGGSAFVGTILFYVIVVGYILDGLHFFDSISTLSLLGALGVIYADLFVLVVLLMGLTVFLQWFRHVLSFGFDGRFGRSIGWHVISRKSRATAFVVLTPGVLLCGPFIKGRLEDAGQGGWSYGSPVGLVDLVAPTSRWSTNVFSTSVTRPSGFLAISFFVLSIVILRYGKGRKSASERAHLVLVGCLLVCAFWSVVGSDYIQAKSYSYLLGPILVCGSVAFFVKCNGRTKALKWVPIGALSWVSVASLLWAFAVGSNILHWLPSRAPDIPEEAANRLWVTEELSPDALWFLGAEGAVGFVGAEDICRGGVELVRVVVGEAIGGSGVVLRVHEDFGVRRIERSGYCRTD